MPIQSNDVCSIEIVLKYREIVPIIVVTDIRRKPILEIKDGKFRMPKIKIQGRWLKYLEDMFEPLKQPAGIEFFEAVLQQFRETRIQAQRHFAQPDKYGLVDQHAYWLNKLYDQEVLLLALAAREDIDLTKYDYAPSYTILWHQHFIKTLYERGICPEKESTL